MNIFLLNLGILYSKGKDVEKDYKIAKEYFELPAEQYNSNALYNLGALLCERSRLWTKLFESKRIQWNISQTKKNSDALFSLGDIFEEGYGVPKDHLKAKHFFE